MNEIESSVWRDFVDLGGRAALRLGLARSLGQVYAALYLSPEPLGLEDLMRDLGISKGNASMSLRRLAELGAVERVWISGERRDFWQARDDFRRVLHHVLAAILKPRLSSTGHQLDTMQMTLRKGEGSGSPRLVFMQKRIAKLQGLRKKLEAVLPVVERVL
ncbi:MAG: helix-turn-helix domain-containing protein [Verrucomicrobiia bacterium]